MKTEMLEAKRTDLLKVDPRSIEVREGFNVREDFGDIESLASSIKVGGVRVPLRGTRSKTDKDKFVLTDGHRRLRAALSLLEEGLEIRVPFILEEKHYTEEDRLVDLIVTNDGKSLTPIEEAEALKRLSVRGLTDKEISDRVGRTVAHISSMKMLSSAPITIKRQIQSGSISATLVVKVLRESDSPEAAFKIIEESVEQVKVSGKKKATAKTVAEVTGKKNSFSELKKAFSEKDKEGLKVRDDVRGIFKVLDKLVKGDISKDELVELLFEPKEEKASKKK